jgi:mRNA interferase RelE/StbE
LSRFRIFETNEFLARLKRLPGDRRKAVGRKIDEYVYPQLREEPHYGPNIKKLKGYKPETWRYRIGDWRIFYAIDHQENIVSILTMDDRKDAYR